VALWIAVAMAIGFAMTNGLHDAANSIAALVATRTATPAAALAMATVFNILGPLLLGAAVAETVAGIVTVGPDATVAVLGAALTSAVTWNVLTWRFGLPSSSGHALVGGLVGAALLEGGTAAVNWGGFDGFRPVGVIGVLVAMAISPVLGLAAGAVADRGGRRATRRASRQAERPIRGGLWAASAGLAFSHGANDAAKSVGIIASLLVAGGFIPDVAATPDSVKVGCALAMTLGTALGGWTIVRTIGRRIFRIRSLDGLAATGSSALVIFGSSLLGAPVSTTQVVASSVVGTGVGQSRAHRVRWGVVRDIGVAWVVTMPATAVLAMALTPLWRWLAS
jgi:inorganic phosphate transporter, PiT family